MSASALASAPGWAPMLLAVFVGGGLGACTRFALGQGMNRWLPQMPLGTLAANLLGGYLVGVAIGWLTLRSDLSPLWRLFLVTGVLGGLTTFSTFSAEVVHALQRGEPGWALATAALHLGGSLALTALGLWSVRAALGS
jgi:fluoride exporter